MEQPSLQHAQAFGLITPHGSDLLYIGGRDPFSGPVLAIEILESGGTWKSWKTISEEISQYLTSSCLTVTEERTCYISDYMKDITSGVRH